MLVYKAWRETRARFLISAATLGWFCAAFVVLRPRIQYMARRPFADAIIDSIYTGGVRNIFVLLVVAFGMGGLAQEQARGSAAFTLALPLSRGRLVFSRAGIGLLEVAALALVPTAAVLGLAPLTGESFGTGEALLYSTQWAATGVVLFAVSFLTSVRLTGGPAALTVTILLVATYASILNVAALRAIPALNIFALMDRPHPSAGRLGSAVLVALVLIAAAARATERQDF
jgi:ABC-2 type transport system permease protein